jgi:hypothetical protein
MGTTLSALKLVEDKKPTHTPLIEIRRRKLSSKLWEQIQLARSQMEGKPLTITKFRSFTDKQTGLRKQIEMPKRIRPWWFVTDSGKVCISIRYGSLVIELAKGKHSIEVASADELISTLEKVKTAVEAGELDVQIESASMNLRDGFKR